MKQFYPRLSQLVPGFSLSKAATRIAGLMLLLTLVNLQVSATDYWSRAAGGNWNAPATWTLSSGGTTAATSFPVAGDNVVIEGLGTVTITGANAAAANVTINAGSTLTSGTFSLTLSGSFTNNGTFIANAGTVNVGGNWTNTGTFTAGTGTVNFNRATGAQTLSAGSSSFYNLIHNAAGTLQLTVNDLTVSNNLTNSSGSLDPNGLNITNNVLFTVSGGTFLGGTANLSIGDFSLSGGTLIAPSGNFTVSGNWTKTGTSTFTPGTNTVTFTKSTLTQTLANQLIPFYNIVHSGAGVLQLATNSLFVNGTFINESGAGNFNPGALSATVTGLTTINGGTYLAGSNPHNFNGGLTINSGALIGTTGIITITNFTLSASGTLTAPSAALNIKGNWVNNGGTFNPGTNTVTFNGAVAQSIGGSSSTTFHSLTVTNSPATLTLASNVSINGQLTVSANAILNLSSSNLTIGGTATPSVLGTVSAGSSTVFYTNTSSVGIVTGAGTTNFYNLDLTGGPRTNTGSFGIANVLTPGVVTALAGTVSFNGGTQNIPALSYSNLTVATAGTKSLTGNTSVSAVLNLNAGILDAGSSQLTLSGTAPITGTGGFTPGSSTVLYTNPGTVSIGALNYYNLDLTGGTTRTNSNTSVANILTPGTVITLAGTVSFNGGAAQSIPALTYANLQTATGGTKTLAGNTIVTGLLTIGGGTNLDAGAATLTVTAGTPFAVSGNFIPSTSTVVFSPNAAQNVPGLTYYNLQTAGGNAKTLTGSTTVQNIVTLSAGSLALGANTLTLTGAGTAIVGAGTLTAGTGTVVYAGTAAQTIGTGHTFNNLTINNAAGVTLTASPTVNATLQFTNGLLNTGTSNTLTLNSIATITGAGAGKYVNGNLRMNIPTGVVNKSFEVGDGGTYAPVQINFANVTTAGSLTINTTAGDHPNISTSEINPAKSVNRGWNLTNAATVFSNYSATFNFAASDIDAGSNTNIFTVGNYVSGNSWLTLAIGARTGASTQATGLTTFGAFQVGEQADETPCGFNSNSNSGTVLSPCIINLATNAQPLSIPNFSAGQYFTLDVIKGINYRIYTSNTSNPSDPLMLSIYNENAPADPALAVSFSNTGNANPLTAPNNVYYLFTASISGKVRVLINKKRDCNSTTPALLTVNVDTWGGSNTLDDQTAAGTNTWVAHVYDGITNVPATGSFNNYLGYNTKPETFSEIFGSATSDNCLNVIYSSGNLNGTTVRTDNFSVRYRMNSTKKGLYVADIRSDDGSRLAVDGTQVYGHKPVWVDGQGPTTVAGILMQLTGSSSLQLDYHELAGGQEVSFANFRKLISNELLTGLNQANCQGNPTTTISGDTLAALPSGITKEGNLGGYQWFYSTTPGGTPIVLPNDTLVSFTPSTVTAPFNAPGIYYIFRQVSLRSTNNINATASPFIYTVVSNQAILTVSVSAPLHTVTSAGATFCYGNSATVTLASSTVGVNYQLRNNSNNAAIGAIVAGTGGPLNLSTGPLYATTTVNVTAINTTNGCTVKMTNLVTFSTTPDGGKSVSANFGLVCVGNSAKVTVANTDQGVKYLLRNVDDSPVSDTLIGDGGSLEFEVPVGYLVDPVTAFEIWAVDIPTGCAGVLLDTVQIATQNLSSPSFDIDQDFCSLDSGKVLLSATNTSYASYLWSTDSITTSIIIQQSGIFTLTATDVNGCRTTKAINVGEELLTNGDFSLGIGVGYETDYLPVMFPVLTANAPQYTVNKNGQLAHANFWGKDHTTKTGNFMIVNGEGPGRRIWATKIKIEANTRYYFSAWAMSLNTAPPYARMVFNIEGQDVGDTADLPAGVQNNSNYGWRRFYGQWDSGPRNSTNDSIIIKMVNLVPGNAGNDFGLDDISFSKLSPVKFFGASIGNGGNNLCLTDTLKLTANLTGGQNPITYDWRGPGGFTSNLPNPVILNAQGGWYYLDAKEGRNCESKDSVFIILSDPTVTGVAQGLYKCQTGISLYVSGMVPNSRNNTIYYTLSGVTGTRVATGVDADASGVGAFYIGTPTLTLATVVSYDGKTLTVVSIDNGSCTKPVTGVSTTLIVKPNNNTWVGGPSGNWVDPWNWCPGVPGQTTNITIPTGTTIYINNNDSARVNDILLQGTAQVKINNGGRLMFWGNFTAGSTGKIDATQGTIETKRDNGNQNLPADYFVNRSISTLLVFNTNTNGKTTITNDSLKILSALLFGNTSADLETNGRLILASSDTATARVGVITGSPAQNVITGDFIVERYLRNAAKWRLLSAPTNKAGQTVRNSWQENGALGSTVPGYGFIAADPRWTSGTTYGFDQRGANSSVKRWNAATQTFVGVDNTNVLPISNEKGYMIFVQGDRAVTFPATNATKLRTTGTLNIGNQTTVVPANQFAIIGNPYASRVDIRTITKTNIDSVIYVWDPSLGGAYGLGQFNTLFKDGPVYRNILSSAIYGPALSENNYIESGMAFMVKGSNVAGSVVFKETDKAAGSMVAEFVSEDAHRLLASLKLAPQGSNPAILLDGVMADFNDNYSNQFDGRDIRKMNYVGETAAWKTADSTMVIDRRSTPQNNDTLHLQMGLMRVQNYQWELKLDNMDYPGMNAYLVDRFKATSTQLSMTGTTVVNFNVQNIAGSYAADRFKIVFKLAAVLPVTITTVTANRKSDNTVQVQWKSEQELNLQNYEVERSTDGRNFMSIASQAATDNAGGRASYSKMDNQYLAGDLFYRIKAISFGGQVQYSAVVKVAGIKTAASVNVHPNPVTGKRLNVRFTAMETGTVRLMLVNAAGQVVHTSMLNISSNNITESIQLSNAIAAGRYQLIITSAAGFKNNQQVIIQ